MLGRFNQINDESASTGKWLEGWLNEKIGASGYRDENGQLDFYKMVQEVGGIWDTLTQDEKSLFSQKLAGSRQASNFANLMQNLEGIQSATDAALKSTGSAARSNKAKMDSIEGRKAQLEASISDFMTDTISSGAVKNLLSATNAIVQLVNAIPGSSQIAGIGAVTLMLGTLGTLVPAMAKFYAGGALGGMATSIGSLLTASATAGGGIAGLTTAVKNSKTGTSIVNMLTNGSLAASNFWGGMTGKTATNAARGAGSYGDVIMGSAKERSAAAKASSQAAAGASFAKAIPYLAAIAAAVATVTLAVKARDAMNESIISGFKGMISDYNSLEEKKISLQEQMKDINNRQLESELKTEGYTKNTKEQTDKFNEEYGKRALDNESTMEDYKARGTKLNDEEYNAALAYYERLSQQQEVLAGRMEMREQAYGNAILKSSGLSGLLLDTFNNGSYDLTTSQMAVDLQKTYETETNNAGINAAKAAYLNSTEGWSLDYAYYNGEAESGYERAQAAQTSLTAKWNDDAQDFYDLIDYAKIQAGTKDFNEAYDYILKSNLSDNTKEFVTNWTEAMGLLTNADYQQAMNLAGVELDAETEYLASDLQSVVSNLGANTSAAEKANEIKNKKWDEWTGEDLANISSALSGLTEDQLTELYRTKREGTAAEFDEAWRMALTDNLQQMYGNEQLMGMDPEILAKYYEDWGYNVEASKAVAEEQVRLARENYYAEQKAQEEGMGAEAYRSAKIEDSINALTSGDIVQAVNSLEYETDTRKMLTDKNGDFTGWGDTVEGLIDSLNQMGIGTSDAINMFDEWLSQNKFLDENGNEIDMTDSANRAAAWETFQETFKAGSDASITAVDANTVATNGLTAAMLQSMNLNPEDYGYVETESGQYITKDTASAQGLVKAADGKYINPRTTEYVSAVDGETTNYFPSINNAKQNGYVETSLGLLAGGQENVSWFTDKETGEQHFISGFDQEKSDKNLYTATPEYNPDTNTWTWDYTPTANNPNFHYEETGSGQILVSNEGKVQAETGKWYTPEQATALGFIPASNGTYINPNDTNYIAANDNGKTTYYESASAAEKAGYVSTPLGFVAAAQQGVSWDWVNGEAQFIEGYNPQKAVSGDFTSEPVYNADTGKYEWQYSDIGANPSSSENLNNLSNILSDLFLNPPAEGYETNGGITPTNDNTPGRPEGYVGEEDTSLTGPTNIVDKLKNLLGIGELKTTTETTVDEAPEVTHETREVETEVITPEIEDQTATVNYEANMETPEAENLTGEIDYEANVETPEIPEVPDQTINVTADTSSADAALNGVKAEEDAIGSNKDVTITAHDNATGVLGTIVGLLNSVTDRSATVTTTYVEEHYGGPKAKGGTVTFQDRKKKFNGERHANGGTTGTNGLVGTWLGDEYNGSGEKKPELVVTPDGNAHLAGLNGWEFEQLPKGTQVYSNTDTKKLLGERHANGGFLGVRRANTYPENDTNKTLAGMLAGQTKPEKNPPKENNKDNRNSSNSNNGGGSKTTAAAKTIEGYIEDIGDKLEDICKQFDTMLSVVEDSIDLLEYEEEKTDTPSEQHFKLLENKLDILNRYQAELEAQGATKENSSDYRDVLKQIAELMQDEIDLRQKQYEHNRDVFEAERNQMEFQGRNDPDKYVNQMIASLKQSRDSALEQAEYLMSKGYDRNSDEVIDLLEEANGYSEDIEDAISDSTERLIDNINKNFKDINTTYDAILWKADKEKEALDKQWAVEDAYYDIESERLAENDRQIDQLQKIQDAEKELAEVKDQRVRVMTANGYEWTTDPKALEQATKNRDDVYRTIERDNRDYNRAKQHKQDEIDLYKSYYGENWQGYEALADADSMYAETERIKEEQEKQSHLQGEILLEAKYGNASTAEILSYMASDQELQKYNQEFFKNELANMLGDNFSEIEGVKEAVRDGDVSAAMDAILKDRGGYTNLSTKEKALFDELNNYRNYKISETGMDVGMKVADASAYELSRGEDVKKAARRGIIESGLSEIRESGKEVTYKDVMNLINQAAKYGSNNNSISEGEIDLNSKAAQTLMNDKNYNVYNETQQLTDKNAAAQNITNETNQFTIQNLQVNADNANDLIVSLQNYTKTTAKLYTARR